MNTGEHTIERFAALVFANLHSTVIAERGKARLDERLKTEIIVDGIYNPQ